MFKRIIPMLLALVCLCGCTVQRIRTDISIKEYETDCSEVKAEIIQLSGMPNADFECEINDKINGEVQSDIVAFDSLALENSEKVRMGNKCVLNISWEEKYNKNNFVSVVEEKYVYTGGAHGNTVRIPKNIDVSGETVVKLADLFIDDGYISTLNRLINELIAKHSEEYTDLWAKPEIKDAHQTDFYIEDNNLVIFFQPYDLSYYARGFVEFPLSLDELSGYLKEEYKRLAA